MGQGSFTIRVRTGEKIFDIEASEGDNLLDVLSSIHDFHINAPCGGKGTCGKCKIRILEGELEPPDMTERKFLSERDINSGIRLACQSRVLGNIFIAVENGGSEAQIISGNGGFDGKYDSLVKKTYLKLPLPSLTDQRDDVSRICGHPGLEYSRVSLALRREIPSILRESNYHVTAVYSGRTLLAVEKGNTEDKNFGIAVDIGTTTVVAYLLDFNKGEVVDSVSGINRQKSLGADVISRIEYTMNNSGGLSKLKEKILSQLGEMAVTLVERNNIDKTCVYSVMAAGNTTMLHLLAGADPSGIAAAPFIPCFTDAAAFWAWELGSFPLNCMFYFVPSISGYIGGDVVAGILASRMYEREELSILIDIGTNGEIVLGNRESLYSCSTAAGPAFEGAHIKNGMGGVSGALDTIGIKAGEIEYTTINNTLPSGICGSGIIDTAALLINSGVVDYTGRILEPGEAEDDFAKDLLEKRLVKGKEGFEFIIVKASESGTGEDITFTQKDIREVQLAKAAISAGIATLLHEAGKTYSDITHLFIAGGFGSYISRESAAAIGLIPSELLDKSQSIGNTAGQGAVACSFSISDYADCDKIVSLTKYIELSSNTYFQGKYMEEMIFPQK